MNGLLRAISYFLGMAFVFARPTGMRRAGPSSWNDLQGQDVARVHTCSANPPELFVRDVDVGLVQASRGAGVLPLDNAFREAVCIVAPCTNTKLA